MIKGSCLCGAIAYEVDMPEEKALEGTGCYCESCRKTSRSAPHDTSVYLFLF
jgi:hypothetical protein